MGFTSTNHQITLPKVVLTANTFGGVLTVPAVTLTARDADGYAVLTVPAVTLEATALAGRAGNGLNLPLPKVTLNAEGVIGGLYEGLNAALPVPTLTTDWYREGFASRVVPAVTLDASILPVGVWEAMLSVPRVKTFGKMLVKGHPGSG